MSARFKYSAAACIAVLVLSACSKSAEYYFDSGNKYYEQKQYKEAIIQFRSAIAKDPKFGDARVRLADSYGALGDGANAGREYVRAAGLLPDNAAAQIKAGQVLLAAGRYDDAKASAQRALAKDPKNIEARLLLGRVLELRNERDHAIATFKEVLKLAPRATAARIELARVYLARGDAAGALENATQAAAERPSADAGVLLIRALLLGGNIGKASEEAAALAARYPTSASVQTASGSVAVYENDGPAAQRAFQTALRIDPDNREALAGLVALDLSQRHFGDAQSRIEKELARRGDDPQLLLMLGRTRSVAGDAAGAEEALKKAVLVAPSTLDAYALLGQIYLREKRLDRALAEFDLLGSRDPRSVGAHTVAAMILQLQNKPDEARKRYEKVLELNPRAAVAANNLAWMYAESGQSLDRALQLAQAAKSQLPDQPDVNDTLGWIYTKKGLPELAIPFLLASIERNPSNAAYHFHLGVAYSKRNREKARTSLERAIKLGGDSPEGRDAKRLLADLT